jgi:hypothetical protein
MPAVTAVRLPASLSRYLPSLPYAGATRAVTSADRDAEKVNSSRKRAYRMAWRGLPCSLCLLPGSWSVEGDDPRVTHPLRLTFGHGVPLTAYGATNVANLTPQHYCCNRAAGERDVSGLAEHTVTSLPSQRDADAWHAEGGPAEYEPTDLPSLAHVERARRARCGF